LIFVHTSIKIAELHANEQLDRLYASRMAITSAAFLPAMLLAPLLTLFSITLHLWLFPYRAFAAIPGSAHAAISNV
jgi:hypothetical protein